MQVRAIKVVYLELREAFKRHNEEQKPAKMPAVQSSSKALPLCILTHATVQSMLTRKETPELRERRRRVSWGSGISLTKAETKNGDKNFRKKENLSHGRLPVSMAEGSKCMKGSTWTKVKNRRKLQKRGRSHMPIMLLAYGQGRHLVYVSMGEPYKACVKVRFIV